MSVNTQELGIDLWDSLDASNLLSVLDESNHPEMLPMGGQPVEVSHELGCDDTITVTWRDARGNIVLQERRVRFSQTTLENDVTINIMNDMCEWDRENDAHHAVFSRDYPHAYWGRKSYPRWCYKEEPEIKAERGGALDEFLDEFKPQKLSKKEGMNKNEC